MIPIPICGVTISGILLGEDVLSGQFTINNTGATELVVLSYDSTVGPAALLPGLPFTIPIGVSQTFLVSVPESLAGDPFTVKTDCENLTDVWPEDPGAGACSHSFHNSRGLEGFLVGVRNDGTSDMTITSLDLSTYANLDTVSYGSSLGGVITLPFSLPHGETFQATWAFLTDPDLDHIDYDYTLGFSCGGDDGIDTGTI
jgi:hypothetical protein